MAERIPYPIFDRPLTTPPLLEQPHLLSSRPNQSAVIDAYNRGLDLLLEYGQELEQALVNGEFNSLGSIASKIETGITPTPAETITMARFGALLDSRDARFGRRNLNFATYIAELNTLESNGVEPTQQAREIREQYQAGNFHLIKGGDYPLNRNSVDRFIVPVRDGDQDDAIFDGAPIEGIIRELDRRIVELQARRDISWIEKRCQLIQLRRDRDTLFTSSTEIFADNTPITHARKQYEAKLKSEDPLLSEWHMPDWFKEELVLRDRRVLDIPRGRNRWCVPLLIPLIGIIPLATLCARQPENPVMAPIPAPTKATCLNPTLQVFDLTTDPTPSYKGHIERELEYAIEKANQRVFRANDDPTLVSGVEQIRQEQPGLIEIYLELRRQDAINAANQILGKEDSVDSNDPFINGSTDFDKEHAIVAQCTSIDDSLVQAIGILQTPEISTR